jgi:hypothetical protein
MTDSEVATIVRADEIYRKLVGHEGLFGKAFFGHRRTRAEARRLEHLWRRARKQAETEARGQIVKAVS